MAHPASNPSTSLRTDRNSGIITCIFGGVMIPFGAFGLLMVALQRLMFSTLPPIPATDPHGKLFLETMHLIHGAWLIYMPLLIVIGVVFVVAGIQLFRGSQVARRVAQVNAGLCYVWLIAYAVSCYQILPTMLDLFASFPNAPPRPFLQAFAHISAVGTTLFHALFPTVLLYLLSRPRS
jgi:hypothetical protein